MPLVYVHGGVAGVAKELPGLGHAVEAARNTASSLDAVERAVRALEDDPLLNAGTGAVPNLAGEIELDAGLVDGRTGRAGGVANVRVRNPIVLARRVMETTPHVLVTGAGAAALGRDMETLDGPTPEQRRRWEEARAAGRLGLDSYARPETVDTVGAVALDEAGDLAAGSSTGGVFGKHPGRVGDAPIVGAGIYASRAVAVVGTGVGETFLERLLCRRVAEVVESSEAHPQDAIRHVLGELDGTDVTAGLLALDHRGRVGAGFRGGALRVEGPHGEVPAERQA